MTTHEQFLAERQTGIGGSDIAAILGISPWATPLDVYRNKLGLDETEQTASMRRGIRLEPYILDAFEEEIGTTVFRDHPMARHQDHHWMLGHIDGWFETDGDPQGVEAKSVGAWAHRDEWGEPGTDEIPQHYLTQCHWYLTVTGWKRWHLTAWFGTDEVRNYVIDRDEDLSQGLIEAGDRFWFDHVLAQVPPDPATIDDQRNLWTRPAEKAVEMTTDLQYHIGCVAELQAVRKKAEEEIAEHQFQLQKAMGEDADKIVHGGKPVATWKAVTSSRIDTKAIKANEPPEFLERYTKTTTSRRFLVTAAGKKLAFNGQNEAT